MTGIPFPQKLDTSHQHLAHLLVRLDLLNADLAKMCDVDRSTVHRWLVGDTPIPHAVIRLLELKAELQDLAGRCRVYWNAPIDEEAKS
jgi:hypothetical protein